MPSNSIIATLAGSQPEWSHAGESLAFVSPEEDGGWQLCIHELASNFTRRLPVDACSFPIWSRDDSEIIFTRIGRFWSINPDGSGARKWQTGTDISPHMVLKPSADGSMIAFRQENGIYYIRPDDLQAECVYQAALTGNPFWGRENDQLIFSHDSRIMVVDIVHKKVVSSGVINSSLVSISPSNRWMLTRRENHPGSFMSVDDLDQSSSKSAAQIPCGESGAIVVGWAPDESFFIFSDHEQITRFNLSTHTREPFFPGVMAWDSPPSFAPDKRLVAITTRKALHSPVIHILGY